MKNLEKGAFNIPQPRMGAAQGGGRDDFILGPDRFAPDGGAVRFSDKATLSSTCD